MKLLFGVFALIFAVSVEAKILVVTDIDDTLRLTNRNYASYPEQLKNIMRTDMPFSGMKHLIRAFDGQEAVIYYVTAAIEPLIEFGEEFLEDNRFPQDNHFFFRMWWEEAEEFKVKTISGLIKKENPDTVILIGDNGEKDPAAYARIQEIFPNTHVYIHFLYKGGKSAEIPEAQFGYVTAAEVAADLEHKGIFYPKESRYVMTAVEHDLLSGDSFLLNLVLPDWSDVTAQDISLIYSRPFVLSEMSHKIIESVKYQLLKL